jgi:transcriptional antiterminator RfaH
MDTAWYTVQAKRHNEGRVVHHLTNRAIPTFLPLVEVVRRRNGLRRTGLEPLFPGYLFVQLDPVDRAPQSWDVVRWSPGVHRILGTAGEPVPIREGVIRAIQNRTQDLGFVRPGLRFGIGDRLRFRAGPMYGLEAILDRPCSRAGRVQVLLALLGSTLRVEADELDFELV